MPFRQNFERAIHPGWEVNYVRFKKHRNVMRHARRADPPLAAAEVADKASKFARKLDRDIEAVDLFAAATAGHIADSLAMAAAEAADLAGLWSDKKVRILVADQAGVAVTLANVREVHQTYCRIAQEVASLISFLDWNVRAVNRLLKLAARTYGDRVSSYSAPRRASAGVRGVVGDAGAPTASTVISYGSVGGGVAMSQDSGTTGVSERKSLSNLDALIHDVGDAVSADGDVDDIVARRSKRSDAIALHAAHLHLKSLSQNHHSQTIAGFIATIARYLDRIAVAEDALLERAAAEGGGSLDAGMPAAVAGGVDSDIYRGEPSTCRAQGEAVVRELVAAKGRMEGRGASTQKTLAAQAGINAEAVEEAVEDEGGEAGLVEEEQRRMALPEVNLVLNVLSAFLYMVSMYAPLPTAPEYAESLGAKPAVSGILIGGAPMAGIVSSVLFSFLSSRAFKGSLLLASVVCMIGNAMYALAASLGSIWVALAGRFVIGFGGARAINRRYIADCAPMSQLVQRSAEFVTASAVGMAAGPAIAAVVNRVPPFMLGDLHFDSRTNAAWLLAAIWSLYILALVKCFVEPTRPVLGRSDGPQVLHPSSADEDSENGSPHLLQDGNAQAHYGAVAATAARPRRRDTPGPLRELLQNIPVMFCLLLYFVIKLVCELLLSSTALTLPHLYGWGDSRVGIFVAFLGALMFPANFVVAKLLWEYEENDQLLASMLAVLVGCVAALPFLGYMPLWQYIAACIIIFISTNAAEAIVMAILAQIVPASLARGTFNSGLLSTEAGMMGRAAGDIGVFFAAAGPNGLEFLLIREFAPCTVVVILCLVAMRKVLGALPAHDGDYEESEDNRSSLDEKDFEDDD